MALPVNPYFLRPNIEHARIEKVGFLRESAAGKACVPEGPD